MLGTKAHQNLLSTTVLSDNKSAVTKISIHSTKLHDQDTHQASH